MNVTITGADDAIEPNKLVALSHEFPFVEWGILFSAKREGTLRYPSRGWRGQMHWLSENDKRLHLSLHLCGQAARDTLNGDGQWLVGCTRAYRRVQLNGYTPPTPAMTALASLSQSTPFEFILQARGEDVLQEAAFDASRLRSASVLFDPSGGTGKECFRWPIAPFGTKMGYAGGIKPATVLDMLSAIGPVDENAWIDMESGVRDSENRFDLGLVREVLEKVAQGRRTP